MASRREVDSVELPYFNRARLSYAARKFLSSGGVPEIPEANSREPLLPWSDPAESRIVLGATVEEACRGPEELKSALELFKSRQYALTYRPETKKVYVMLRAGVASEDTMRAVFDAHTVLHIVNGSKAQGSAPNSSGRAVARLQRQTDALNVSGVGSASNTSNVQSMHDEAVRFVAANGNDIYRQFESQAKKIGWKMNLTMLNSSETRLAMC